MVIATQSLVPGGSANDYDYAAQDPVNRYDLDGNFIPLLIIGSILIGGAIGGYIGYQWAHAHHYNTAGTIAATGIGVLGGAAVGRFGLFALGGRGLGVGGYRIVVHVAHKPFPVAFIGGLGRTIRWLWNHPDFRSHMHWEWRGVRYPRAE